MSPLPDICPKIDSAGMVGKVTLKKKKVKTKQRQNDLKRPGTGQIRVSGFLGIRFSVSQSGPLKVKRLNATESFCDITTIPECI